MDPFPHGALDPFSIEVGPSPFAFVNDTHTKLELWIKGTTFSTIEHTRQGANGAPITSAIGMTSGTVLASPGDTITVTYSIAPTMAAIPHA